MATDAICGHRFGREGALFMSGRTPLLGFREPGYDPSAIMASRIAEAATVVFLGASRAGRLAGRR